MQNNIKDYITLLLYLFIIVPSYNLFPREEQLAQIVRHCINGFFGPGRRT